jgi:ABC-type branched-subunit amino acid transport system ATPase component
VNAPPLTKAGPVTRGLTATDVVVRFGGLVALDHVSVEAPAGQIVGLIGPNGAGKTTMFNVICGFQNANDGKVILNGHDVSSYSSSRRARLGIGRTFQRMELFSSLTVRENVELAVESLDVGQDPLTQLGILAGGRARRRSVQEEAGTLIDEIGLTGVADRLAGEVSTGQGRLVELARALARRPSMLLLDEPSSGLDPTESRAFGENLTRVAAERDLGILMVEHDMALVLGICDDVFVLDFGKPLMCGTPDEVRSSPEVRAAYLGNEGAGRPTHP